MRTHVHQRGAQPHTLWGMILVGLSISAGVLRAFSKSVAAPFRHTAAARVLEPPEVLTSSRESGKRDCDIEPAHGRQAERRERVGLILSVTAFSIAIAGGIGFLFVYWSGGSNELLGITLALSFGGLGSALVLWAHWLMLQREAIEPREPVASAPRDEGEAFQEFYSGERRIKRRKLLLALSTGVLGIFAAAIVSLFRSLGKEPGPDLFPTVWKRGQRLMTIKGEPLTVDSLEVGSTVTVFPEGSLGSVNAQTVLIRVPERLLQLPKDRSNWAPMGYVAYSRVCTHAGCPVGEFESQTNLLLCPCHQSTFAVLNAAQPTAGPAARPLPQLPLYIDTDGSLRAAGDFSAPPGPGFWGVPS